MKFLLSVSFFALATTVAHAGPGSNAAKMGFREMIPNTSKYVSRTYNRCSVFNTSHRTYESSSMRENKSKFIPRKVTTMHKRTYMQGYKPEEQVKQEFQYDDITKTKVLFLDKNHERYKSLGKQQQSFKEISPVTEKKDDHTLVVTIKKKEN